MLNERAQVDLLIIGGGINGTGIAVDAASRGLTVLLCEQNDLASGTSSNSSKLIHGGLRYLEQYEFSMVRSALKEREILLNKAPHVITPLRFTLPHLPHLRPAWMIRAGLFMYDNLASRVSLPGSQKIKFDQSSPLKADIKLGFQYSDAWADDARLVMLNALSAKDAGAKICNYTKCVKLERHQDSWTAHLQSALGTQKITAKAIVNAAGPWAVSLLQQQDIASKYKLLLVKGSHLVVPRIHAQDQAYILQNQDGRIVFVLPFEQQYSLIGTTDVEYRGDPTQAVISQDEIDYLLSIANQYFKQQITQDDVVHTFCGVRSLVEPEAGETQKAQEVSRDYKLELDHGSGLAPMVNVLGGKLTTYRVLAEKSVDLLHEVFPQAAPCTTEKTKLSGGDFADMDQLRAKVNTQYPWLSEELINRFTSTYGTDTFSLLQGCHSAEQLGQDFGAGLFQIEVDYLVTNEWATNSDDILWRRTKLGLKKKVLDHNRLDNYLEALKSSPRQSA